MNTWSTEFPTADTTNRKWLARSAQTAKRLHRLLLKLARQHPGMTVPRRRKIAAELRHVDREDPNGDLGLYRSPTAVALAIAAPSYRTRDGATAQAAASLAHWG